MKKIIIHIGLPKSASTSLQLGVFSKMENINYLGIYPDNNIGRDISQTDTVIPEVLELMSDFWEFVLNGKSVDTVFLASSLDNALSNDKVNVISNEKLTGVNHCERSIDLKFQRLTSIFDAISCSVEYLLVLRNQSDFILSQYADLPFDPRHVEYRYTPISLEKYLDLMNYHYTFSIGDLLQYDRLIDSLSKYLDLDKLHVIFFEDIRDNREDLLNKLQKLFNNQEKIDFSKSHYNSRISSNLNGFRRLISIGSAVFPSFIKENGLVQKIRDLSYQIIERTSKKSKTELTRDQLDLVRRRYAHSNENLSVILKLKLPKEYLL